LFYKVDEGIEMKINEMIRKLEAIRAKQGNIEVIMFDRGSTATSIGRVKFEKSNGEGYPDSWNMPQGFKFVRIEEI
jgi:hypothetical protein